MYHFVYNFNSYKFQIFLKLLIKFIVLNFDKSIFHSQVFYSLV
jgi:hypothetical protein